jgi:hypothetical protein
MEAMAFLRTPDPGLAGKYLDATASYLALYDKLIGPYPYKKFALVENFWETGFGMPSFTLLGPKIIRLPFIITTSYPHEILHNWWGNSVFPAYEQGNWSEGLTAYLADHLMKEQQAGGAEYRLNTLQKYADYVFGGRDFPLTQFRSRHSSSSEAIGYGKALMFFHMLRLELGDDVFKQGLQGLYKNYAFRSASFADLRTSFEAASGKNLAQQRNSGSANRRTCPEGERSYCACRAGRSCSPPGSNRHNRESLCSSRARCRDHGRQRQGVPGGRRHVGKKTGTETSHPRPSGEARCGPRVRFVPQVGFLGTAAGHLAGPGRKKDAGPSAVVRAQGTAPGLPRTCRDYRQVRAGRGRGQA